MKIPFSNTVYIMRIFLGDLRKKEGMPRKGS